MNLTIKKTTILTLALFCQNVFSGDMGSSQLTTFMPGWYVGGALGVSDLQDRTSHSVETELHHLGGIGIVGGGVLGYEFNIYEHLKLGVEGFGNAAGLNTAIKHYDLTTGIQDNSEEFKNRYNAGIRILPGYQFNPHSDAHLIFGYANGSFKNNDNGTYGYLNSSFYASGFQSGVGWKTDFFQQSTLLRLDMLYTRYANKTSRGTALAGSGTAFQYYSDTFSTLEADITLIYKFC